MHSLSIEQAIDRSHRQARARQCEPGAERGPAADPDEEMAGRWSRSASPRTLLFALVTLPAGVVLSRLRICRTCRRTAFPARSGTAAPRWCRFGRCTLGSVEWDLHVLALFTGRMTADVEFKRERRLRARRWSRVTPSGTRSSFEQLTASLPLTALPPASCRAAGRGTLNLKFAGCRSRTAGPCCGRHDRGRRSQRPGEPARQSWAATRSCFLPMRALVMHAGRRVERPRRAAAGHRNGATQEARPQLSRSKGSSPRAPMRRRDSSRALEVLGPPDAEGRRQFGTRRHAVIPACFFAQRRYTGRAVEPRCLRSTRCRDSQDQNLSGVFMRSSTVCMSRVLLVVRCRLRDRGVRQEGRSRSARRSGARPSRAAEGQVDIVAWPGYIERGETDTSYDWVTDVRSRHRLQGQRQDRRHLRRDGVAHDPGRLRPGHGFGRRIAAPDPRRHGAAGRHRQGRPPTTRSIRA